MKVHFSSKRNDWETPNDLFEALDNEFHFKCDLAANSINAKVKTYIVKGSLDLNWSLLPGPLWLNPPYGREIGKWVKKAYEESQRGATVVCLLPARTDTKWFHDYVLKGEVRFLRGRVMFVGSKFAAPFPSLIVVFRGK